MGRWRYLNLALLLACGVFLYLGLFTARSPLVPRPMGAVVHPMRPLGSVRAQIGHGEALTPGAAAMIQVRFCPRCYREIHAAGVAIAEGRPGTLDAPGVAPVRGQPHRFAARAPVPKDACQRPPRLWLGIRTREGRTIWTAWAVPSTVFASACTPD